MSEIVNKKSQDINIMTFITEGKNERGIPAAKFIENIEEFLEEHSVESALGALNELYSKYKYMEGSFEKSKNVYKSKIPDIDQTLELIRILQNKKDEDETVTANYNLSDTIFAKANVDVSKGIVYLWVGANTMVEFEYSEAIELLQEQLEQSKVKLSELNDDLNYLRGNSITVEVNMARLFNYNVKLNKSREVLANS